jgi:uncharacterized protein RhaS with RHS repeats
VGFFRECFVEDCPFGANCREERQCSADHPSTPNPISIGSGAKFLAANDYRSATGLAFTRHYSSASVRMPSEELGQHGGVLETRGMPSPGRFGTNWRHSHQASLLIGFDRSAIFATRPDGRVLLLRKQGARWVPTEGASAELTELTIGSAGGSTTVYRLALPNENRLETYSMAGYLLTSHAPDGTGVSYIYSDGTNGAQTGAGGYLIDAAGTPTTTVLRNGLLLYAIDHLGRRMRFDYTDASRLLLARVVVGDEAVVRFEYGASAAGCVPCATLNRAVYADGTAVEYRYDEQGQVVANSPRGLLTSIIDEAGNRFASYKYDASGRAHTSELAGGVNRYALSWDAGVFVTGPLGTPRGYLFWQPFGSPLLGASSQPAGSGCAASSSFVRHDALGNVEQRDDFVGNRTCYANDQARYLEIARVEGLDRSRSCASVSGAGSAIPPGTRKISTAWHPQWRLPIRRSEPGRVTTWVYNGQPDPFNGAQPAACAPPQARLPDGKPIAVLCVLIEQASTDIDGAVGFAAGLRADTAPRIRRWTYNTAGQVTAAVDPLGRVTAFEYHAATTGAAAAGDLRMLTNPLGQVTSFARYDAHGHWLESVDPSGGVTRRAFGPRQRLTAVDTGGEATVFEYWPTGLLRRVVRPDGTWLLYEYDDAQRLRRVSESAGDSVTFTLDAMGNRVAEETRDAEGRLRRVFARSFDALGRVEQTVGREETP